MYFVPVYKVHLRCIKIINILIRLIWKTFLSSFEKFMSCCQVTLESLNLLDYPSIPVLRLAKRDVWFLLAKFSSRLEHSAKRNMKCDEVLVEQLDSYSYT